MNKNIELSEGLLTYNQWIKSIAPHYAGCTISQEKLREMYFDEMDMVFLRSGLNK